MLSSGIERHAVADTEKLMNSTRRLARIAGLLYLIVGVCGGFAQFVRIATVYVPGDAATTAQNVVANSGLVRMGFIADLIDATVFVFLAMTLYLLLRHVNMNAAGAMVVLVAIAAAIQALNLVFQFAGLRVATDPSYVGAFGIAGAHALVLLLFDIQHYGYLIDQIFFGLWLVPLGYLAYTSRMFPRALGVLLIAGGACYLVGLLAVFLVPQFGETVNGSVTIVSAVAELWMVGYLLIGVRTREPDPKPVKSDQSTLAAA